MSYKESAKVLNDIRGEYGEMMFRVGISHLLNVGTKNLTDDIAKNTCEEIMKQDDSKALINNDYQCQIVECACKIAKIDHIHLLVYISKNVKYSV